MEGPPLGPLGEDITLPDQVAPRGRRASSTRKIKPQTSNLASITCSSYVQSGGHSSQRYLFFGGSVKSAHTGIILPLADWMLLFSPISMRLR